MKINDRKKQYLTDLADKMNRQKKNWYKFMCVCIVSGVNEPRLSHDQKAIASITISNTTATAAVINGDIDKSNLESTQPFQRRRNWWLSTHTTIQKDLLMNAGGRYECPRDYCRKTYKEASSLQRHIRCVL